MNLHASSIQENIFLSEHLPASLTVEEFGDHWNALASEYFEPAQWTDILRAALDIRSLFPDQDKGSLRKGMRESHTLHTAYGSLFGTTDFTQGMTALEFFSKIGEDDIPAIFYQDMHNLIKPQLADLNAKELVTVLRAFDRAHLVPQKDFWAQMQDSWFEKLDDADDDDMANFYHAAARLALKVKPKLLDAFANHVLEIELPIEPHMSGKLLWSCAVHDCMNLKHPPGLKDAALRLYDYRKDSHFRTADKSLHNSVCAWFDIDAPEHTAPFKDRRSWTENNLRDIFADAGAKLRPLDQRKIPMVSAPVDIRMLYAGKDIILEVDGLRHFNFDFAGHPRNNGSTRLSSAVKAKMADEACILHMDHSSCDRMIAMEADTRDMFAKDILKKSYNLSSGNYRLVVEPESFKFYKMANNLSVHHANRPS